jgi:hypothetical protein
MDRVFPWGEKGRELESRLKRDGLREAWHQRTYALRKLDKSLDWNDARWKAGLEFPPDRPVPEVHVLTEDDQAYILKCREGLQLQLPQRAGVERELDWVGANAHCALPDVQSAPSYFVLNFMIAGKLNPKVLDQFWANSWSKRMSPGDSRKKAASSVSEDQVDESAESHEEHLRRLLGGGGG